LQVKYYVIIYNKNLMFHCKLYLYLANMSYTNSFSIKRLLVLQQKLSFSNYIICISLIGNSPFGRFQFRDIHCFVGFRKIIERIIEKNFFVIRIEQSEVNFQLDFFNCLQFQYSIYFFQSILKLGDSVTLYK